MQRIVREMGLKNLKYHLLALLSMVIWGTTFTATKVLIESGLSPVVISLSRFILAYITLWIVGPHRLRSESWRDEGIFVLLGLTGASLYFIAENTAIKLLPVADVTFLTCGTTPIFIAMISAVFLPKESKFTYKHAIFTILALSGVGLVVYSGSKGMSFSALGDALAIGSALIWGVYLLFLKLVDGRYPTLFISRKIFFYGMITLIPFLFITDAGTISGTFEAFRMPKVWSILLFLGIVASMLCYSMWNFAIKNIGTLKTSYYLYVNPVVSLICAITILGERVQAMGVVGCIIIISSVYMLQRVSLDRE